MEGNRTAQTTRVFIYLYSVGIKRTEDYILALESSFQHLADDPIISRKCDYISPNLRAFKVRFHIIFLKLTIRASLLFGHYINLWNLINTCNCITIAHINIIHPKPLAFFGLLQRKILG
eukprot:Pompholyxophrys_punicea_v1_NODE_330_length_2237_cov_5.916132.p2 type:complete len:119 gc:universal NODE_330_length_2237_cov_5.916132:661-305(-)